MAKKNRQKKNQHQQKQKQKNAIKKTTNEINKKIQKLDSSTNSNQSSPSKSPKKSHKKSNTTKDLVVIKPEIKKTETTFSKKLEAEISKTKEKTTREDTILLSEPERKSFQLNISKEQFAKSAKHFSLICLVLMLTSGAVVVLEAISSARILPRTALASVDLGYLQIEEAKAKIDTAINEFKTQKVVFILDQQPFEFSLEELDITISNQDSIDILPTFNFQKDSFFNLIGSTIVGQNIKPVYQFDSQKVQNLIEEKLELKKLRAKNAAFIKNEEGALEIRNEQAGQILDYQKLQQDLENKINNLDSSSIQLSLKDEYPTVESSLLENKKEEVLVKLESPLTLNFNGQKWSLDLRDHLDSVIYQKAENADDLEIKLSNSVFDQHLQTEIFEKIEIPVSNVKIFYDENQKIKFEGRASNGLEVKREEFKKLLEASINTMDSELEIPTEEIRAQVDAPADLQEKGVKELISVGHTKFSGSTSNRRHNIQVSMNRYDGVLLAPGETFSFNEQLGPVDGSTGYKLELVIKSTGTVPEFGGGVCQVSSTLYKSALLAGLTIDERSPHSYAVSYYAQIDGHGLDATIYPGVKDLRFTNNTPGHILMHPVVDGDHAYINFYGTSDGRRVELANYWRGNFRGAGATQLIPTTTLPPGARKQVETASGGFDAKWDRIIYDKDGNKTVENIYSAYRSTANKILVGQE